MVVDLSKGLSAGGELLTKHELIANSSKVQGEVIPWLDLVDRLSLMCVPIPGTLYMNSKQHS